METKLPEKDVVTALEVANLLYILFFFVCFLSQFQSQVERLSHLLPQKTCMHIKTRRKKQPGGRYRNMCLLNAPEREFWDCWQPCYLQPNQ